MEKEFYIYILASKRHGNLYIGVTSNLVQRVYQHRNKILEGFTKKYSVHRLVYFERYDCAESAIKREKRLKSWHRRWKIELIESLNPEWRDLYKCIVT